jgi:hypothetical protein
MKRYLSTLALALCVSALAACGTTQTVNPADVASAIADGCLIVQPTLAGTSAAVPNADLALATGINGVFCTANEAVAAAAVKAAVPVTASAPVPASQ